MCHDCGCQRARVIAVLCRGHERMLELAQDLAHAARTGDEDEARRTAEQLYRELAEHIEIEERDLFPALLDDEDGQHTEHVESLRRDHRSLLAHLDEMPRGGPHGWAARLLEEVSDIGTHVLKEEYGFFPEAFATMPPEQRGYVEDLADPARREASAQA